TQVTLDVLPPSVVLTSPTSGQLTNTNVTVAGQVTDDLSGVASLRAQVDAGSFFNVSFAATGHFSFATALSLGGSADGNHTVSLQATDRAGNVSGLSNVSLTLDTRPPTAVGLTGTFTTTFASFEVTYNEKMAASAFSADNYSLTAQDGSTIAIA